DASADKKVEITNGSLPSSGSFRILVNQGGNFYLSNTAQAAPPAGAFAQVIATGLTAASFSEICLLSCGPGNYVQPNVNSHPDFSSTGALMTFGVLFLSPGGSLAVGQTN